MRTLHYQISIAFLLAGATTGLAASSPAIGLATARGSFQVNASRVWGSTSLFEGSIVETAQAPSQLQLDNGFGMRLAAESRARVERSRVVLEKGLGQLESGGEPLEARTLRIFAGARGSIAQVQLQGSRNVLVAALRGSVRVTNAAGLLVADMGAGNTLSFDPQAGASAATRVSGCLLKKDGKLIVVDRTTNVTLEVRGPALEQELGNQVEITGTAASSAPAVAGASQLIQVSAVKRTAKGGCASTAKKAGAAAAAAGAAGAAGTAGAAGAAAGAAAGIGVGTTVAVVGGVAAAATVGGLAAAGTLSGDESAPTASR